MKFLPATSALSVLLLTGQAFAAPASAPVSAVSVAARAGKAPGPFTIDSHIERSEYIAGNSKPGYEPLYLSTYASTEGEKADKPWYMAGIWAPQDNATVDDTFSYGEFTEDEFLKDLECRTPEHYRPTVIKAFNSDGVRKYSGIWVRGAEGASDVEWTYALDMPLDKFQADFDQAVKDGFKITYVSGSEGVGKTAGTPLFSAVYEKRPGTKPKAWQARVGLTGKRYQEVFDQMLKDGLRLVQVEGYTVKGVDYYGAIWEKSGADAPAAWQAKHGLSEEKYNEIGDALIAKGYVPTVVSVYGDGVSSKAKYAGIWEKPC